jgi:hypothetical protein
MNYLQVNDSFEEQYILYNILCIPTISSSPISIQGFFTESCCNKDTNTNNDYKSILKSNCIISQKRKKSKSKYISLTQLIPSTLYQCKCNAGISFTNSSGGPPNEKSIWNTNFVPISCFSNFSINGLHGVKRVIIQNITNNSSFSSFCSNGPTLQGNPLGKINNKLGLYEYSVCNDNFKFGPVHLGYDNWLQGIPALINPCKIKGNYITLPKCCGDKKNTENYSVLDIPIQLRLIFMMDCQKKTQIINLTIYFVTCEGPTNYPNDMMNSSGLQPKTGLLNEQDTDTSSTELSESACD